MPTPVRAPHPVHRSPADTSRTQRAIPARVPHPVHRSPAVATSVQRTAQQIKMPPLAHLKPQVKGQSAVKTKAKANRLHSDRHIDHKALRILIVVRGILLTLIFLINGTIIALILASLAVRTGGVWESLTQIPNWFSLIAILGFLIHRMDRWMFKDIIVRNLVTFGVLASLGITNAVLFTTRIQHGRLCVDFSGLESHSCRVPQLIVALSWIGPLLATLGCLNTFFSLAGKPPEQRPVPLKPLIRPRALKSPPPDRNPGTFRHADQPPLFQCLAWGVKLDVNSIYPPYRPLYFELQEKYDAARAQGTVFPEEEAQKIRQAHLAALFGEDMDSASLYSVEQPAPVRILDAEDAAAGWVEIPLD